MEIEEGISYLRLEGGDIGKRIVVVVGVPKDELSKNIDQFKEHGLQVTQLDNDTVKALDLKEVCISNPIPFTLPEWDTPHFVNEKVVYYKDDKCLRCANRYRRNEWCNNHHQSVGNCYRFKLEK